MKTYISTEGTVRLKKDDTFNTGNEELIFLTISKSSGVSVSDLLPGIRNAATNNETIIITDTTGTVFIFRDLTGTLDPDVSV